jgi:hypothetical protein
MKEPEAFAALTSLLEAGRDCAVPVRGVSMFPFLRQGDLLHLGRATAEELRLGDLIAYRREEDLVVHRFAGRIRREGALWLRQKGDNLAGGGLIPPAALMARVAWVETGSGTIDLLAGPGRRKNFLLGCRARVLCAAREALSRTARRLGIRRGIAP